MVSNKFPLIFVMGKKYKMIVDEMYTGSIFASQDDFTNTTPVFIATLSRDKKSYFWLPQVHNKVGEYIMGHLRAAQIVENCNGLNKVSIWRSYESSFLGTICLKFCSMLRKRKRGVKSAAHGVEFTLYAIASVGGVLCYALLKLISMVLCCVD